MRPLDENHPASEANYRAHLRRKEDCERCRKFANRASVDRRVKRTCTECGRVGWPNNMLSCGDGRYVCVSLTACERRQRRGAA